MNTSESEAKEKTTNSKSREERGRLNSFLKWAAMIGVSDSQNHELRSVFCLGDTLNVSYFPNAGGRGIAAARDIARGELILTVPKSALFTTDSLMKDERLSVALKSHPSLSPTQALTVSLLYEMAKGKASPWYSYLLQLPHSYDILAAFGEFEKQALQVDYAIWDTQKAALRAEDEWKEASTVMKELMLKPQLLTLKAWVWATGTISSRTLHIPWDEAGCLCPVGDFFNYAAPGEDSNGFEIADNSENGCAVDDLDKQQSPRLTDAAFEEDVAAYCFYSRKNYIKGEQVLLGYGTYTNLELLEHYGFLLEDNPNEKIFIPLELEICSSSSWPKNSLYIHQNGKPSFALVSALRLWATPPHQRKSIRHLAFSGSQLSTGNEIAVMRWIAKKCQDTLKDMPTSIEEDNFLVALSGKIQDFNNLQEWGKAMPAFGGEFCDFLKATCVRGNDDEFVLSRRTEMLLDRWKLAVQWRVIYKKALFNCISYCTNIINTLKA